jgi:hypothetical protein
MAPPSFQTSEDLAAGSQLASTASWDIGRTQTEDLSPEVYGMMLQAFEKHAGPEHVREQMNLPHFKDRLPQEPVWVCCVP